MVKVIIAANNMRALGKQSTLDASRNVSSDTESVKTE